MTKRFAAVLVGLIISVIASGSTMAQQWPERNVTIVVPYAAGGSTDIMARLLAEKLRPELGVSIVIENRPGAGSNVGSAAVAKAAPDGHTLLVATSALAANVALYKKTGFDFAKDLTPVSQLTRIPNVLTITNDLPANSVTEFIAYAKANRGKLNYGSSGSGASQHLAASLFMKMADLDMAHVPYKGGSQATNDLVAGHIQVVFAPLVEVLPFIESGKVRALGLTTKDRISRLPELPTIHETLPGFEVSLWNGLFVPAGAPAAVVEKLATATRKAMADSELQNQIAEQGSTIIASGPAEFQAFVTAEIIKWAELVRLSGAKLD